MIKNIFFDMDMTLLNFEKAERNALKNVLLEVGEEPTDERLDGYSRINRAQWKLLEKGELTRERLRVQRYEIFAEQFQIDAQPEDMASRYEKNLSQGFDIMPGAVEVLEALQGKYRMFITSNGTASVQHSRIDGSGIGKYFEDVFISQEIGYPKPDERYFDACFASIAKSPLGAILRDETVIIGDSLSSDILGGIHAGIITIWLNGGEAPTGEIQPDYQIRCLAELPALLDDIIQN